ncbi:hypothetical protein TS65_14585 [Aneurinibacillus migulanus]|uniref:Uncharacterized protein n=1 Tax=Aneurinibacillus migulanus TaxID=47500 RepID=A0A0D1V8C5_ANEMI|nr:hypothetical protein TS65_14585 [Aneurinibacillus migulanus]KON95771.1 hypothetical protein AF333_10050 [Aneurinibacillus migulanus]
MPRAPQEKAAFGTCLASFSSYTFGRKQMSLSCFTATYTFLSHKIGEEQFLPFYTLFTILICFCGRRQEKKEKIRIWKKHIHPLLLFPMSNHLADVKIPSVIDITLAFEVY